VGFLFAVNEAFISLKMWYHPAKTKKIIRQMKTNKGRQHHDRVSIRVRVRVPVLVDLCLGAIGRLESKM